MRPPVRASERGRMRPAWPGNAMMVSMAKGEDFGPPVELAAAGHAVG